MIQIKHRYTGKVIKEVDATSLVNADLLYSDLRHADLRGADMRGADLRRANLQYANLQGVDLQDADIRWAIGEGEIIKTIIDQYEIVIMLEYGIMAIGCEQHSIDKWMNFSNEEIDKMDTGALHWWKTWKPIIQQILDSMK